MSVFPEFHLIGFGNSMFLPSLRISCGRPVMMGSPRSPDWRKVIFSFLRNVFFVIFTQNLRPFMLSLPFVFSSSCSSWFPPSLIVYSQWLVFLFTDLLIRSNELVAKNELSLFSIRWWFIWFCRNNLIFRDEHVSHIQGAGLIYKFSSNWLKSSCVDSVADVPIASVRGPLSRALLLGPKATWSSPPTSVFKLNYGSKLSDGSATFGLVIRNATSQVLLAGSQAIGSSLSTLQAEAWGIREGIRGVLFWVFRTSLLKAIIWRLLTRLRKCWAFLGNLTILSVMQVQI